MQNNLTTGPNTTKTKIGLLPPRASLITSSADHPKKAKAVLHVQKQEVPLKQQHKK